MAKEYLKQVIDWSHTLTVLGDVLKVRTHGEGVGRASENVRKEATQKAENFKSYRNPLCMIFDIQIINLIGILLFIHALLKEFFQLDKAFL